MKDFSLSDNVLEQPLKSKGVRDLERAKIYSVLEDRDTTIAFEDPIESTITLNMGPQHPATHGVLRVLLKLDGEKVLSAVPELGYLHRAMEKIAENKTFHEFMPYTDRLDYISPYSNNVGLCLAVEKLGGIEVPERANFIRVLACELSRISSHLLAVGCIAMDSGAVTAFVYTYEEREKIYDIFDELTGVRFTVSHSRIGGVSFDVSDKCLQMIRDWLQKFKKHLRDWQTLLYRNKIFYDRLRGISAVSKDTAIDIGLTGPNLRASGVEYDIRKVFPYLVYDRLDFDVPIYDEGDCMARYLIRMDEMFESVKIIEQVLEQMPKGEVRVSDAKSGYAWKDKIYHSMEGLIHDFMMAHEGIALPVGEVYHAIEAPKGEFGIFIQSDGSGYPWRLKIRTPSFANLQALPKLVEGGMISDVVVAIGSLDPVMGDADKSMHAFDLMDANVSSDIFFSEEDFLIIEKIVARYPERSAAIMPVLWLAQDKFGWLSRQAIDLVANALNLPKADAYGVASFYTMYFKKPVGKIHLAVCTNVSCKLAGSYSICNFLKDEFGLENGVVSDDGTLSLEEAECLGCCEVAPVVQVCNADIVERVSVDWLRSFIKSEKLKVKN
ncbi:hypothetical protein CHS0354_000539 [Potamilus streckersoni]|uniref:Complex I-49kD n=1 Tax=Potamilus streckersoni TaxID=2493646 RepID=A0AAE0W807_9BIVA|nr:hypothetical protein CHS0354_000539 [Potamilus streckersoni]